MARPKKKVVEEGASAPSETAPVEAADDSAPETEPKADNAPKKAKTTKVRLLCSMADQGNSYGYGEEVELDADHADRLIASGGAEKP